MAYIFETPIVNPLVKTEKGEEQLLKQGFHVLSHKQMPDSWLSGENLKGLMWAEQQLRLPEDVHGTLFKLRGTDIPIWPRVPRRGKTPYPTQKAQGTLVFVDKDNQPILTIGGPKQTVQDGQLRFCIQDDTQLPSLILEYRIPGSNNNLINYRVVLHGNTSMKTAAYYNPAAVKANALNFDIPEKHKQAAEEERVVALTIEYGSTPGSKRFLDSITVLHDLDHPTQRDRWNSNDEMIVDIQKPEAQSQGFDRAVRKLFMDKDIKIVFLRDIEKQDLRCDVQYEPQYNHWAYMMNLSIKYRPFWFYRMQKEFSSAPGSHFASTDKATNPPPVPFWLVTKFAATVKPEGLTQLTPIEWEPIVPDPTSVEKKEWKVPHPDFATFLHELSIVREKAWQGMASNIMFESGRRHPMTVKKTASLEKQVFFRVDIAAIAYIEEGTQSKHGDKILPPPGSSLKIELKYGNNQSSTIIGTVVDEVSKPPQVDLVVHCSVRHDKGSSILQAFKDQQLVCNGTLSVVNNYVSVDRMLEGLRGIAAYVDKDKVMEKIGPHPDARALLLKYDPRWPGQIRGLPNVQKTLEDFALERMNKKASFGELCRWFGFHLNKSQEESVLSAIEGGKGNLTVIRGPPGTGKSHTIAAFVVLMHVVFKGKIAICAPSNQACEAIMEKVLDIYNRNLKSRGITCNLVRLLTLAGTPLDQGNTNPGRNDQGPGLEELAVLRRKQWKSDVRFVEYSFYEAKRRFVDTASSRNLGKELAEACSKWSTSIQSAINGVILGEEKKGFRRADERIGREILKAHCDILVGTLNSMGRPDVDEDAGFSTIVIDECAQATLGEIAIPFNKFSKSIVRAVVGGDDLQLSGFLGSERANEVAPFAKVSIFKELRTAEEQYKVVLLNTQYRCHPHIYHWSNQIMYKGQVSSHSTLSAITGLDRTVAKFMSQQVGHIKGLDGKFKWDGNNWPRVIAIDINGNSQQYPGSASSYNPGEVEFATWLRKSLLNTEPPQHGEPVTSKDITMISPYRGQVTALKDAAPKDNSGLISTVAKSQGSECVVGISCFAKNDTRDISNIGFTWVPASLNVWFTRQKRFHFVTGNFTERHARSKDLIARKRDFGTFTKLLEELCACKNGEAIVLRPRDFCGWPGFSNTSIVEPSAPRATSRPSAPAMDPAASEQLHDRFNRFGVGEERSGPSQPAQGRPGQSRPGQSRPGPGRPGRNRPGGRAP